jgi:hypothetical protein
VAERTNALVLKTSGRFGVPWVQIPPLPPNKGEIVVDLKNRSVQFSKKHKFSDGLDTDKRISELLIVDPRCSEIPANTSRFIYLYPKYRWIGIIVGSVAVFLSLVVMFIFGPNIFTNTLLLFNLAVLARAAYTASGFGLKRGIQHNNWMILWGKTETKASHLISCIRDLCASVDKLKASERSMNDSDFSVFVNRSIYETSTFIQRCQRVLDILCDGQVSPQLSSSIGSTLDALIRESRTREDLLKRLQGAEAERLLAIAVQPDESPSTEEMIEVINGQTMAVRAIGSGC